jgi:hypothetical protein
MNMHRNRFGLSAHAHRHTQSRAQIGPIRAPSGPAIGFVRVDNRSKPIIAITPDVLKIADRKFRSQFLGSEFVNIFWLFPDDQMDERRTDRYENPDS